MSEEVALPQPVRFADGSPDPALVAPHILAAIRLFRENLEQTLGRHSFHSMVTDCAERTAEALVHTETEAGRFEPGEESLGRMLEIVAGQGFGKVDVLEHDWSEGWLLVECAESLAARLQLERDGLSKEPSCDVLRGHLAGAYRYVRRRAGMDAKDLVAVETSCLALGDRVCRFAVAPRPVLEAHGIDAPSRHLRGLTELEEALGTALESEAKLRAFVEGMPFGLVGLDAEGRVTFANHKALDLVALPARKVIGTHFSEHVHPDDREVVLEGFRNVVEGRADPYPIEGRIVSSTGAIRECSVDAFAVTNAHGEVTGYQAVVVDLSEQERTQNREQRLHLALRESPWPYMELEPEGRIRHVNAAAAQLIGEDPERLVDRPFTRMLAREQSSRALQSFLEVASGYRTHADGRWDIEPADAPPRAVDVRFLQDGMKVGRVEKVLALLEERRGEEWFRAIIENGASVYAVLDARGKVIYESPSLTRVFGWLPEEIVGKSLFELVHPEDIEHAKMRFGELLADPGVVKTTELRYRHKDGAWRLIEACGVNLLQDPVVEGVVITSLDITERKRAENALHENHERFVSFVTESAYIYVELDLDGNLTFANERAAEATGYSVDELLRMHMSQLLFPEDLDRAHADLRLGLSEPNQGPREYRVRAKDGSVIHGEVNTLLLRREGRPAGFQVTVMDVTARKRAEAALVASEEQRKELDGKVRSVLGRYEALAGGRQVFVYEADSEGIIREIRGPVEESLGFSARELAGLPFPPYVHADDLTQAAEILRAAAGQDGSAPKSGSMRCRLRRRDGSWGTFAFTAAPVAEGHASPAAVVGFMYDVTELTDDAKRLAEYELLCDGLMANESTWVMITDPQTCVRKLGRAYDAATGFDGSDRLGKPLVSLLAPGGEEALDGVMSAAVHAGEPGVTLSRVRLPFRRAGDGKPRIVELEPTALRDDEGRFQGLFAVGRDVTDEAEREATELERHELALELAELRSEIQGRHGLDSIIGRDPKMRAIFETILAVSRTQATVLIQGETGTGKELVAKAIHYNSPRKGGAFVKVDCGALAETLLESELFGHVKGAFTGAVRERRGRFEVAADGTIFLDEVHNLSVALQVKLLRVVQDGAFEKVGGTKTQTVDVRIIAATNEDLGDLVARGLFRKDLYYRLNVIPIRLPALADRRGDVPLLASSFVERYAERHSREVSGISREALDRLLAYDWPGNVRELENIVEQAVVFCRGAMIQASDVRLPEATAGLSGAGRASEGQERSVKPLRQALEDPERRILVEALGRAGGNKKRAAQMLGISRSALYEKIKKHGLSAKRDGRTRPNR